MVGLSSVLIFFVRVLGPLLHLSPKVQNNIQPSSSYIVWTCSVLKHLGRPPVIKEHPSDAVVEKNSPAELTCSASGFPEPKISWYRNGVEIPSERRRSILPNGHLYFIRTVSSKRKTDNGIYSCKAENRYGTVYSKNASLFIGSEWFLSNNNIILLMMIWNRNFHSLGPAAFYDFLICVEQDKACSGLAVVHKHQSLRQVVKSAYETNLYSYVSFICWKRATKLVLSFRCDVLVSERTNSRSFALF